MINIKILVSLGTLLQDMLLDLTDEYILIIVFIRQLIIIRNTKLITDQSKLWFDYELLEVEITFKVLNLI